MPSWKSGSDEQGTPLTAKTLNMAFWLILLVNITIISIMISLFVMIANVKDQHQNTGNEVVVAEDDVVSTQDDVVVTELPIEEEIKLEEIAVCNSSNVKTYMDYKAITDTRSMQYALIRNHLEVSDGYLYDKDGYMAVALGSYWGDIGDRFTFYLDSGIELKVIKTDRKADNHTFNGCNQRWDGSVLEIIIDSDTTPYNRQSNGYYWHGNWNNNPEFRGNIERVYKVVE